jgi:hypothetical protein
LDAGYRGEDKGTDWVEKTLGWSVGRMQAGNLESDLCSRVARTHHQNDTFLELRGVTVLAGM